jgi:AcrR family transcriptional regulator
VPSRLAKQERSTKAGSARPYRKTKRALSEAETRQRIVEATVGLHQAVGPAKTTVKAIAQRAGVQRATVYKHFPDLQALFDACNAHYYERHPLPDPASWASIASPAERLRVALRDLYSWFEETELMVSVGIRDIDTVPPATREAFFGYFQHVAGSLMTGRRERGRARSRVAAAIGHAISFATWRSLVREGSLSNEEAAELMQAMVDAAAR